MANDKGNTYVRGGKKTRETASGQAGDRAGTETGGRSSGGLITPELVGIFFILCSSLLGISLLSHHHSDPSLNHAILGPAQIRNWAGMFGSYLSALLADLLGFASYVFLPLLAAAGIRHCMRAAALAWWRWIGFIPLTLCVALASTTWGLGLGAVRGGGLAGRAIYDACMHFFNPIGTGVIWCFIFLLTLQMLLGFSWVQLFRKLTQSAGNVLGDEGSSDRGNVVAAPESDPSAEELPAPGAVAGSFAEARIYPVAGRDRAQSDPDSAVAETEKDRGRGTFGDDDDLPPVMRLLEQGITAPGGEADGPPAGDANAVPYAKPGVKPGAADHASSRLERLISRPASVLERQPEARPDTLAAQGRPEQAILAQADPVLDAARGFSAARGGSAPGAGGTQPLQPVTPPPYAQAIAPPSPKRVPAKLPPLDLLSQVKNSGHTVSKEELVEKGHALMACLKNFSVQAELVRITPGPVVTSFEVRPAPGVRSAKISNLNDDLALSLKAVSVRVQAPIPGTDTVGIEIPNDTPETVSLYELLASKEFQNSEQPLCMALGKDIGGLPNVADLARMPHLLVAGATGAGKSVFLNSVILSFLYKARPEELKFLLIDPKRIEMAVYADLPHLVHPIVTEMPLAKNALDWAVSEMDRRYSSMARLGVRNLHSYNQKIKEYGGNLPPNLADLEPLPYLVVIIDELSDLMLTVGKDVETSIVRLAQLARAAGIHLIIATQRPSVDVVTGLIKANFPCRISFQVTSKHDSRTILDTVGAERLLGRGDMLYKPAGGKLKRLHGALVPDDDVPTVADYWRKQQAPVYQVDFTEWEEQKEDETAEVAQSCNAEEQIYNEIVAFARDQGKASISLIQRRFRLGFNRAARYIEQMEEDGIIGPADGSKPRQVR